jgi:WD40 repeat protein
MIGLPDAEAGEREHGAQVPVIEVGGADGEDDQLQAHKPKFIARQPGPRPARSAPERGDGPSAICTPSAQVTRVFGTHTRSSCRCAGSAVIAPGGFPVCPRAFGVFSRRYPRCVRRLLARAGGGVAAAGLMGVVTYLITRVSDPRLPLWPYGVLIAVIAAGGVLYTAGQTHGLPRQGRWLVPSEPEMYADRAELGQVVRALAARGDGQVVVTTVLAGVGGFGKTTLAQKACHDRAVRRRFRAGLWITVGHDTEEGRLAARISDAARSLGGDPAGFIGLEEAGRALAAAVRQVSGPVLLIADDVWTQRQLDAFRAVTKSTRLLVTTRKPEVLHGTTTKRIIVDRVDAATAKLLLTRDCPQVPTKTLRELSALAGGWPLLLSLINRRITDDVARGAAVSIAAEDAAARLRRVGPSALDVSDSGKRETAVAATIGYSLDSLGAEGRTRFFELGIFASNAEIPVSAVAVLWRATRDLSNDETLRLCERMDGLALLSLRWNDDERMITIHDVILGYVRHQLDELGPAKRAGLHNVFVMAAAAGLPPAGPLDGTGRGPGVAWWEFGWDGTDALTRYLRSNLVWHLSEADGPMYAEALACDLRWVGARLAAADAGGPAEAATDLSVVGTDKAARMRIAVTRAAHLLAPTGPEEPVDAVIDILHSRIADDPDWGPQVTRLRNAYSRPRLVNRWPLPDLLDPALRTVLQTDRGVVWSVCPVTLNGQELLASGGLDGTVRVWDLATRQQYAALSGHQGEVRSVCPVTLNGRELLASGGLDGTVRVWDLATRQQLAARRGRAGAIWSVCPVTSGNRSLLAIVDDSRAVRIWDPATGKQGATLQTNKGGVRSVCPIVVDGQELLASSHADGTVRIWDPGTGKRRATLQRYGLDQLCPVTVNGQGLLVGVSYQGKVRVWDPATRKQKAAWEGWQGGVLSVCPVSLSGQGLLASGSDDGTVRIWDPLSGKQRVAMTGHRGRVWSVCPVTVNGQGLLASGGDDGTVRVWDPCHGEHRATRHDQGGVRSVCRLTVNGQRLLIGASYNGELHVWDPVSGEQRQIWQGRLHRVSSMCPVTMNGQEVPRSSSRWSMLVDDTGCILLPAVSLNHHRLVLTPSG